VGNLGDAFLGVGRIGGFLVRLEVDDYITLVDLAL